MYSEFTPTRRNFLRGGLATAALSLTQPWSASSAHAAPTTARLGGGPLPYSPDSFFKSKVIGSPVDAARTTQFKTFMKTHADQKAISWPKITGTGTNQWGTTFHVGTSADPVWKVVLGTKTQTAILKTQGFHMADAVVTRVPTGTQDRPMCIVDEAFGYTVFFADVVPNKANRTLTVSASGITYHSSNGLDGRNPKSNDKRNWTSRGRLSDACIIRPDRVAAGIANNTGLGHVLQFFFVETKTADGACHPMVGSEGDKVGFGAEGERVAIRANVDLKARGLTGAALVIARTLQEHGAYLGDNSGSSTQLKGPQCSPGYNPWAGTNMDVDCLKGKITWDDFYVLPKGWQ